MKRRSQLPFLILLVVALGVGLTACNSEKKASFETKVQEEDFATFEIPKDWEKNEELSSNEALVYAPIDAEKNGIKSYINIVIQVTGQKVSDIETVRKQFEANYEKEIKTQVPDAGDFKILSYKADIGDVLMVGYKVKDTAVVQNYPLVDNAIIAINSTNYGDLDDLDINEVTKHMVDTFTLKGNDSE